MSEDEFKEYMDNSLNLRYYECVNKFKSVLRAFKKGYITKEGIMAPKRPFNNRKPTKGRSLNELKKSIYGQLRNKYRRSI
jgi:hypothetical protein